MKKSGGNVWLVFIKPLPLHSLSKRKAVKQRDLWRIYITRQSSTRAKSRIVISGKKPSIFLFQVRRKISYTNRTSEQRQRTTDVAAMRRKSRRYFYNEEFDPGSGWTLATGLTHASRGAAQGGNTWVATGARVSNTYPTCPILGDSLSKERLIPDGILWGHPRGIKEIRYGVGMRSISLLAG